MILQKTMALTGIEIAIGGITSIPVTAGLIFLGYKTFGQKKSILSRFGTKIYGDIGHSIEERAAFARFGM